ncbi:LRP2-binding protein-like [Mytilus galloprovincialis]|uniref:LRP2-binding protein-like n=1 Tax=Mytilus galloprovincialis TaxID=29158 RepID=UPI003F7BBF26
MDMKGTLSAEKVPFTKEKSILNDIAQETKDKPGYGNLTEEELMEKVETILLERIKNGDKKAYFQLGLFYYEQDMFEKARTYFERSKDFDYQSLYMLSCMLYDGIGGEADEKCAIEYLKKIAHSDSRQTQHIKRAAQFNVGRAFFEGYGVGRQSDEEAERYWLMAADDGNPKASILAQTILGMYYSRADTQDLKKAFFWHSEACGNGSIESQGCLGIMYEFGIGVKQDMDSAYVCLKEASDRGNVYAMGNLVGHYYRRKLYTKAADLASRVAQFHDVPLLSNETGCLPGYISKGIALGCFYYARCLHEGHGVKKEPADAQKYYSKSYQYDPDVCARLQNITQHGVI